MKRRELFKRLIGAAVVAPVAAKAVASLPEPNKGTENVPQYSQRIDSDIITYSTDVMTTEISGNVWYYYPVNK